MDILLFGGLLLDRYFTIDRWPQRGQDGFFENEENFVGGCAINMAVTIRNLGGQAHVVSALGSDAVARTIRDYLTAQGLSQALVHPAEGDTGSCLVCRAHETPERSRQIAALCGNGEWDHPDKRFMEVYHGIFWQYHRKSSC